MSRVALLALLVTNAAADHSKMFRMKEPATTKSVL